MFAIVMSQGVSAASVLNSLPANRADFGIYTLSFTGGRDIFCPTGQLMSATRRLNPGRAATLGGFLGGLNVLTIYTFVIENIVSLIAKEHIQNLLNEDLQPPFGSHSFLIIVRYRRCLFDHAVTAIPAGKYYLALLRASRFLRYSTNVIVPVGRNDLTILMTAYGTSVANIAILGTSGSGLGRGIVMANSLNLIGGVPFAADRTDMLIVALLGAGRSYPNGCSIVVPVTVMNAFQYKRVVSADRHAFSVTCPTVSGIPDLFLNLRGNDFHAERQNHSRDQGLFVRIKEADGVLAGAGLNNGACHDIHRGSGRNGIRNTVSVQIPANQYLGFFQSFRKLQIWLTNDLMGQEYLTAD